MSAPSALTPRQREALEVLNRAGKLTAHAHRAFGSVYRHGFRRATFDTLVRAGFATREAHGRDPNAGYLYRPTDAAHTADVIDPNRHRKETP